MLARGVDRLEQVKSDVGALANEWAKYNITVNAIGPAYFESEMTDMVINTPEFGMALRAYRPMAEQAGLTGRAFVLHLAIQQVGFSPLTAAGLQSDKIK